MKCSKKCVLIGALITLLFLGSLVGCRVHSTETPATSNAVSNTTQFTTSSSTTTESSKADTASLATPEAVIAAHQDHLQSRRDQSTDAGYYLQGQRFVVCATDEITLAEYRKVLEPLDPEETVIYELKEYSLARLKRVMNELGGRKDLGISNISLRQTTNRLEVMVPDETYIEPVCTAAGENANMLEFKVGITIEDA